MKLKEKLFMGIDIGTSGVRAAVFDIEGKQLSLAYRESPMLCHKTGMGEGEGVEVGFGNPAGGGEFVGS